MLLRQIFDPKLAQYAYLIGCQRSGEALIIDPERDVDRYIELAEAEGLRLVAAAETHIHADFVSGSRELAEQLRVALYLSDEGGPDWRYRWTEGYDVHLLKDGDTFTVGHIEIQALHTPGHTPEHLSFLVTDRGGGASEPIGIASGDFVFVGDLGRPDLLESAAGVAGQMDPSARTLFRSVDRFLALPNFVQVWPGHGAGSACGKSLGAVPSSTVGYEKLYNSAIDTARLGEQAFVDAILSGQPEPPLYFATMKRWNRDGPPVLGGLPEVERLDAHQLLEALDDPETVVVDTRTDRHAFMQRHLAGSLLAPLDKSFPSIVGSYVRPEQRIVLLAHAMDMEEALRDLVRIGFDNVGAFAPPEVLDDPAFEGLLCRTRAVHFNGLDEGATVLDVRGAAEFGAASLPDALNIAHTRLLDRLDEVPREGTVQVHCRTGGRAATAVALLERSGYDAVWVDDAFDNAPKPVMVA